MVILNFTNFLRILFGFLGIAYLITFIYSIISNINAPAAYELGEAVGFNLGFVSVNLGLIALVFTFFFIINVLVNRLKYRVK